MSSRQSILAAFIFLPFPPAARVRPAIQHPGPGPKSVPTSTAADAYSTFRMCSRVRSAAPVLSHPRPGRDRCRPQRGEMGTGAGALRGRPTVGHIRAHTPRVHTHPVSDITTEPPVCGSMSSSLPPFNIFHGCFLITERWKPAIPAVCHFLGGRVLVVGGVYWVPPGLSPLERRLAFRTESLPAVGALPRPQLRSRASQPRATRAPPRTPR